MGELLLQECIDSGITIDQILENRVKSELYYQEAQRQGIAVCEEEARKFANETRISKEKLSSKYDDALFEIALAMKGLSEDEYWEKSILGYQRGLSVGKLREQYSLEEFDELGEKLKAEAEIEYLVDVMEYINLLFK